MLQYVKSKVYFLLVRDQQCSKGLPPQLLHHRFTSRLASPFFGGFASFFHYASSGCTPFSQGWDGRSGSCAGFAPNHKPRAVCHSPRRHSRPATLLPTAFCPFANVALFFLAAAQVKEKTADTGRRETTMKLEEINNRTKDAVNHLVEALESGQSEVLTQYLSAMARSRSASHSPFARRCRGEPPAPHVWSILHSCSVRRASL
jgi:hypothetical protein